MGTPGVVDRIGAANKAGASNKAALVVAGAVAAGLVTVAVRDPGVSGSYGVCPFRALTGLDCPFCGGLRGTHALLHGDVAAALDYNALLPMMLVGGVIALLVWWRGSLMGLTKAKLTNRWVIGSLIAVLGVFWILRMLPAFPYLASTS